MLRERTGPDRAGQGVFVHQQDPVHLERPERHGPTDRRPGAQQLCGDEVLSALVRDRGEDAQRPGEGSWVVRLPGWTKALGCGVESGAWISLGERRAGETLERPGLAPGVVHATLPDQRLIESAVGVRRVTGGQRRTAQTDEEPPHQPGVTELPDRPKSLLERTAGLLVLRRALNTIPR